MSNEIEHVSAKDTFMNEMESLRPDLMYPESWDETKVDLANKVVAGNGAIKQMFASIPMVCKGSACPMKSSCGLYEKSLHPLGKKCPIELRSIRDLSAALGKSLNIDYDDFTEVSQLRVMVDQEIQMIRKSHFLAEEGFIMENVIGVSDDGEPITKKELSLGVELEDRIHKRLKDYGDRLIATRSARAKINGGETDSAKVAARIMREIANVDREREKLLKLEMGDIIDAEIIDD